MLRIAINLLSFLLISGYPGLKGLAQTSTIAPANEVKPAKEALTYEDFAHQFKGCPENSECDELMGKLLADWKLLAERWEGDIAPNVKEKEMQTQLRTKGWPVEFYTKIAARTGLNPVLFASSCREHNPKDAPPADRIWRGQAFLKGTENGLMVFSRGDTEFKIKQGDLIHFRPVILHREGAAPQTFWIPLDESPAYVEQGKLRVLVEAEGAYALLIIPSNGAWEVKLSPGNLSEYFEGREDVPCPKNVVTSELPWFPHSYCQKIIDKDSSKSVVAQFFRAC